MDSLKLVRAEMTIRILTAVLSVGLAGAEPLIIAHRGGAALRPENTVAAFENAMKLGVPVLEFDMNLTADDKIIVHHDSTVNQKICRADPGSSVVAGPIRGLTLAQLKQFECGSFDRAESPRFRSVPGQRMPTLDEFFAAVRGGRALLLGETKMPPRGDVPPDQFVRLIDAAIRKYGVAERFILQSADYRTLAAMRKQNPAVRICVLNGRDHKPEYLKLAREQGAGYLMLRAEDVTPDGVRQLKAAGIVLYSGTANRPEEWARYVELGFDGILTDDPVGLQEFYRVHRQ